MKEPKPTTRLPFALTLATGIALALAACAPQSEGDDALEADRTSMAEDATAPGSIVEIAAGDNQFSTLADAVSKAGLAEALSGEGPFTVFAPTNEAFAKVDEVRMSELTTSDTETLGAILRYHVVEGAVDASALAAAIEEAGEAGHQITTLGGDTLTASMVDGAVVLTDATGASATVTATDVEAGNGLIHAIDGVLMPQ